MRRLAAISIAFAIGLFAAACGDNAGAGDDNSGITSENDGGGNVDDDALSDPDTNTGTADAADEDGGSASSSGGDASSSGGDGSASGGDGGASSSGGDATDGGGTDSGDAGPTDCPGGKGCKCEENNDCDSGVCIETAGGKVCAQTCVDSCQPGFTCTKYDPGSGDAIYICTDNHLSLCSPCNADADCQVYGTDALCVDHGIEGKFCGSACKADADCPTDYACTDVKIGGGNTKKQCKLKDPKGVCSCSQWAISNGKGTGCSTTNDVGTCKGTRSCGKTGLSKCDAPVPAEEKCDNIDSDCNGKTDDIDAANFKCEQKAWFAAGSKKACKADADCTEAGESCADDTKTCRKLIGACPGKASCEKGKLKCVADKAPKQEMCNGEDDDCDGDADEDYVWKHPADGTSVKIGGTCGAGLCAGGTVKCETLSAAVCDTESVNKAPKDICNGKDDDCDGSVDEHACDDGNPCTTNTCNVANLSCETTAAMDCDDKNPCTADSCDSKTGKCVNTFTAASCDDGDACTEGDKCAEKDGKAICEAGKAKNCDDGNVCTDESCDKDKGCVTLSNAVTQACYSGQDPKTEGVGTCVGGIKTCKDGVMQGKCVGEILPAVKEACDGKDDSCDGKTDEGCTGASANVDFVSVAANVAGKGKIVGLAMPADGSSASSAAGKKHEVDLGLRAWLKAWLGK